VKEFSVLSSHFYGCLQNPEIIPLIQTLFLEPARSHSEPTRGKRGEELLDRDCLMSCSIVMVENPIGPKFQPLSMHIIMQSLQYFHIISMVHCLALWNEFKVNNALDTEESDEHSLHL
jgi:hypothetical protein